MLSSPTMPSPFNPLDYSLGDPHSSPSLYSSSSSSNSTTTPRPKTFTRVARGIPANSSSTSLFPTPSPKSFSSSSTTTSPSYLSLSNSSSSLSSECTANSNSNNNNKTPNYSHTAPSSSNVTTARSEQKHSQHQQRQQNCNQHGLNRFRPSLYTSSSKNDFLEDIAPIPIVDIQSSFTAHPRVDRKDLLQLHQVDPALVLLSQDELAEKHVASAPSPSTSLSRYSPFNKHTNNTTTTTTTTDSPIKDIKAVSKPCPTFTRITKPRTPTPTLSTGARTGFYRLGDSGNKSTNNSPTTENDLLLGGSSSSLLPQEENGTMPSLSLSTSSPSSSCLLSPWSPSSSPSKPPPPAAALSLSTYSAISSKPSQSQLSLKAPAVLLPPLALSLSLSPPPSSVPSLSSSASSACSSASSSSSPPTSRFLFPSVDHHHEWWQGFISPSPSLSPYGLEQGGGGGGGGGTGSRTAPGTGTGSSLTTLEDCCPQDDVFSPATTTTTTITTPSSHTFYRQQPQSRDKLNKSDDLLLDKDPVIDHLAFTPAGSAGLNLTPTDSHQNKDNTSIDFKGGMDGSTLAGTSKPTTTPSTRKTYSLARTRAPPHVITGFCSISKTPIKPSGEPSPQDFLGEADLPYPLPSTLHDRQIRQRKRAEQLRQLKIREECEAQEKGNTNSNRRRVIRRRGNSFSAGMMYSPASTSSSPLALSTPYPFSNSIPNSPTMFSDSPRMPSYHQRHSQQSTPNCRSATWHQQRLSLNQHLKRSPSSPTRGSSSVNNLHLLNRHSTCNIGQGSKDKLAMLSELSTPPARRQVAFDLVNIQVFEYDVSGDDWSPSSGPSSPTIPPASTNGRDSYIRYCPPSDCSSSGSSDEESPAPRIPTSTRDLKSKASS